MNRTDAVKILVVALTLSIALTQAISVAQAPKPLTDSYNLVNVYPANVVWEKTFGGIADDRAFFAVPAGDGYLVVGSTASIVQNTTVGWAIRVDGFGNAVWNKTFLEGTGVELRYAINLTDGFLLVGNEFLSSGENGFVAKIDDQGNIIWNTTLGDPLETCKLFGAMVVQGNFLVLGAAYSNGTANSQGWAVKLDQNGSVVWSETYGNTSQTVARSGVLAQDGDYMVAGYSNPRGGNNFDFLLMKIDAAGTLVWNQTYGGAGSEEAHSMAAASDGYVIVGDTQTTGTDIHAWVVKVDLNGNLNWTKTVSGKAADSPSYITPTADGFLVTGFTFSWGAGNRDFWLFKIDDLGQVQWSCTQGDAGYQEAYSVIAVGSNQYVMAGWTDPLGQPSLIGKAQYDFEVVKVTAPQNGSGLSAFQIVAYALITFGALLAVVLVVTKIRKKPKTNPLSQDAFIGGRARIKKLNLP